MIVASIGFWLDHFLKSVVFDDKNVRAMPAVSYDSWISAPSLQLGSNHLVERHLMPSRGHSEAVSTPHSQDISSVDSTPAGSPHVSKLHTSPSVAVEVNHHSESEMPPAKPSIVQVVLVVVSFLSLFVSMIILRYNPEKSILNVGTYAWITTASTGVGAVPFFFISDLNRKWLGVANALAGGMMTAASLGLIWQALEDEGVIGTSTGLDTGGHGLTKVFIGITFGVGFMVWSKNRLDEHGDLELGNLQGASAQRALLIIGVMTLHSFAEGLVSLASLSYEIVAAQ